MILSPLRMKWLKNLLFYIGVIIGTALIMAAIYLLRIWQLGGFPR